MTSTIQLASVGDAEVLADVAERTFRLACPAGTAEHEMVAFITEHLSESRFAEYLANPGRVLFVARVDGAPAGYTMVNLGDPTDPDVRAVITARPTAELSKCYVDQSFHGAGLGPLLMQATIDHVQTLGIHTLWLGVNQLNERANAFYAKNGFELRGPKKFTVGSEVHNDFVRERVLVASPSEGERSASEGASPAGDSKSPAAATPAGN